MWGVRVVGGAPSGVRWPHRGCACQVPWGRSGSRGGRACRAVRSRALLFAAAHLPIGGTRVRSGEVEGRRALSQFEAWWGLMGATHQMAKASAHVCMQLKLSQVKSSRGTSWPSPRCMCGR
jgi:hypothetical protein